MKSTDTKLNFIKLRAEGKSYAFIAKTLSISKDTCHKWEVELKVEINELKKAQLQELYDTYHMTREARVKKLGKTLERIEDALAKADLTKLPPDKLLDYRLKYLEALNGEYIDLSSYKMKTKGLEASNIIEELAQLVNRLRSGEVSATQASRESHILINALKAYEATELKTKIEEIEAVIKGRQ